MYTAAATLSSGLVLLALKDADSTVRATAGTATAAITTQKGCGGLRAWPQLLPTLAAMLNSGELHQVLHISTSY
jgi:hypothetical protein